MAEMTDAQILAAWRGGRLKVITQECLGHGSKIALQLRVRELEDRIEELETRYADKSADVAQLIEQLQKAEAQNAARPTPPPDALTALNIVADHQVNWNINDWRDWWEHVGRPATTPARTEAKP